MNANFHCCKMALMVVLTIGFVLPVVAETPQSKLSGHWEGQIEIPNQPLKILLDFSKNDAGEIKGTISIPAQNASNLALDAIIVSEDSVRFTIKKIPGNPVFKGSFSTGGTSITGDYTQGGNTFSFAIQSAMSPTDRAKEALEGFDKFTEQAVKDWNVPGLAVGIVVGNQLVYAKGFGLRDMDEEEPVTPQTLFAIGSATKAFTTFTMATLVNEGMLEWDTPVRDYLPGFRMHDPVAADHLTPRDLVTHRSGLPRHDLMWYNNKEFTREDYVKRLRYLEPSADLRQKYQYNNLMFLTAGYLVEQLTDMSWEEAVRTLILHPLGMHQTNFSVAVSQKSDNFALPYREDEETLEEMPFRNITTLGPAGSVNSNIEEMSRWVAIHLKKGTMNGKTLLTPALVNDMHTPHMTTGGSSTRSEFSATSYGLGWFINTYRGHKHVHHGGNIDGFTALVTLFPNDGIGIIALANKNGTGLPGIITKHAADRILDLEPIDWNKEGLESREKGMEAQKSAEEKKGVTRIEGTDYSHELADYAGEYKHPGYGVLTVSRKKNGLEFTYNNITTPLQHWHYDVFNGGKADDDTFEDMKLLFRIDMGGNIASVEAPFEPSVGHIEFVRQPSSILSNPEYLDQFTGEYLLVDDTVSVSLSGNRLNLTIPGQPTYTLLPDLGEKFQLKEYSVIKVSFEKSEKDEVIALFLDQPNGRFTANRLK